MITACSTSYAVCAFDAVTLIVKIEVSLIASALMVAGIVSTPRLSATMSERAPLVSMYGKVVLSCPAVVASE